MWGLEVGGNEVFRGEGNDQWLRKGYYGIRLLIRRQAEFVS